MEEREIKRFQIEELYVCEWERMKIECCAKEEGMSWGENGGREEK